MRVKQIVLPGIIAFFLLAVVNAMGQGQMSKVDTVITFSADTTIKKNPSELKAQLSNDPKLIFKDLFVTAAVGNDASAAKLNPQAISFVNNYIAKNGKGMRNMKEWGKPYFDLMDAVLTQHGLPKELKYLAVIESGLKYNAISWAGAVGPWALMPATAKTYGLSIVRHNDERLDYFKSTHAAASLLTDLFAKYGDWLLVIAAYNGGPGNVDKAIRRSGSKDFWSLQYALPAESMNHVKKFIATHYILESEGGITTVTKNEAKDLLINSAPNLKEDEINNSTAYNITGRFSSAVIIKYVEMDMATFNHYNPGFDNKIAIDGKYELRLPTQKMNTFVAKKYEILDESVQLLLKQANSNSR
jgi:membrane-bound lytic murein transglycosylase D